MPAFKLPRLQFRISIVDSEGRPTNTFLDFFNNQFAGKIEQQENSQAETLAAISLLQTQQAAQLVQIQDALALAGYAVELADGAAGGSARSGSNSAILPSLTSSFQAITQVDLLTVSAGNLTMPGSYPYVEIGAAVSGGSFMNGEYQVVEIDNGVDAGVVFNGTFTAQQVGTDVIITDTSSPTITSVSIAQTTINSVSYRLEARSITPGVTVLNFGFYLFARRS